MKLVSLVLFSAVIAIVEVLLHIGLKQIAADTYSVGIFVGMFCGVLMGIFGTHLTEH